MPLRSPKMYFCIFGFHRFVWWPKCTPASSSSFIVSAAMRPPSVCLRRAQKGARPSHRMCPACVMVVLRRVLAVEPDVLFAQIAHPDPVLAAAQPEVDRELVLTASHDLADALHAHAFSERAVLHHGLVAEGDAHLVLVDPGRRLAQRHHDPPPVGVGPV